MTDPTQKTPAELWDEFLTKQADSLWGVRQELDRVGEGLADADEAHAKSANADLDLLADQVADLAMQINAMADRIKHEGTALPPPRSAPTIAEAPTAQGQERGQ